MIEKSRTHVSKFLKPLTPSVEKIADLLEFKSDYIPRNINVLFSHCGS